MKFTFDWAEYAKTARQMVSEGCVLLRNEGKALPIKSGEKVSVFGRIMFNYIKSGTGSGGLVNAPYIVSILDALKADPDIQINEELLAVYEEWVKDNPFDKGPGWAMEPWAQKEMPVSDELAKSAADASDLAIVIIGRLAGEDRDNVAEEGGYYLTKEEEQMLEAVTKAFDRVVVLLNVGNVIDMKWVDKYNPSAVMYCWQGGCEGGNGIIDILNGTESPSGKLADTIAYNIEDYPSSPYFGDEVRNFYVEDVYVGYRYFETVAKDKVMYPFGFGLSYTSFNYESTMNIVGDNTVRIDSRVTNTGKRLGKEVIQVYYEAPQGKMCKPARELVGFAKTDSILPGMSQTVSVEFTMDKLASFDDSGITGFKNSYVLEAGEYIIYAGTDVRSAEVVGSFTIGETFATETLTEACTPTRDFKRMAFVKGADGTYTESFEEVPLRSYDLLKRIEENLPESRPCTGDKGYKFAQVMNGEVSIEDYIDQFTDLELIYLTRGEGMCSPKVTPGVASAFGGTAEVLNKNYGMPIAATSDGPSGIRMDCGTAAFSLPNGAAQACSFNLALIEKLYEFEAMELRSNKIDTLLGPGINIHRNPLNGRNFEYYSEDPYLTGICAVAELKGLHKYGVTGTCKHFSTNNQETKRHFVDAVVSARALREIYFKPFEMAVREGGAYSIMTTYSPLNGIYTASNYDLNTTVLRGEWGFNGMVMTDWWARCNETNLGEGPGEVKNTATMIKAQNDVYMVSSDSADNGNKDNAEEALASGMITRGELLKIAYNVCAVLKRTVAANRLMNGEDEIEVLNPPKGADKVQNLMPYMVITEKVTELPLEGLVTDGGVENTYTLNIPTSGFYDLVVSMKSDAGELSQTTLVVSANKDSDAFTINGTNGEYVERKLNIDTTYQRDIYVKLYFAQTGIQIGKITLVQTKEWSMLDKRDTGEIA